MKGVLPRNSTFTWSPATLSDPSPYIATGTVAGALDATFSNESTLEIWKPSFSGVTDPSTQSPIATLSANSRFNRLSWGFTSQSRPKGLLAAGLDNGEISVWDAQKMIDEEADVDALLLNNTTHTGSVRGLDFNNVQTNLLGSGGINGEIFVWDLNSPEKPYSPGARSSKLDEITALRWNAQVPQVLATSSSSGYAVIWDLKNKREVATLSYGGGAGTAAAGHGGPNNMNGMSNGALASGGRRVMGAMAWHPDAPTRIITASEDDASPVLMLWDLRNCLSPEKILRGHTAGILSVSWCKQDSDLLVSCGKDNRTILWNPQTCDIVGELPTSGNWSFETQWCPRNPNMLATASFDGRICIHSIQSTNAAEQEAANAAAIASQPIAQQQLPADGSDIFGLPSASATTAPISQMQGGTSLQQPPKWLRRPVSATFGFAGQLVSTGTASHSTASGQAGTSWSVRVRDVITEPQLVTRANKLQQALDEQTLSQFCEERSLAAQALASSADEGVQAIARSADKDNWRALYTLFQADSRDQLVALLGFDKAEVHAKVAAAIASFTGSAVSRQPTSTVTAAGGIGGAAVVSTEASGEAQTAEGASEDAASGAVLESTEAQPAASESGPSNGPAPTEAPTGTDASFFDSGLVGEDAAARSALPEHLVSHQANADSSVAATQGSPGPSSVAASDRLLNDPALGSENGRTTFRIYPADESDAEKLITRALVLGDFESAVSLCLSSDRFADALLLAVRGGPELLTRTQQAYFERKTGALPYLRLYQSIVTDDLTDIVQNADLAEWTEIFVVLCTFANGDEFSNLTEQLGQRLEWQYRNISHTAGDPDRDAKESRKNAIICYLGAGKLEKVAGLWIDEMREEEEALRATAVSSADPAVREASQYSAHASALQTFMEKITVFQHAVGYVDVDLQSPTQSDAVAETGTRAYKLAALYDRTHEYIDVLAEQGMVATALKYVDQTPTDYHSSPTTSTGVSVRERLTKADAGRSGGRGYAAAIAAPNAPQQTISNLYATPATAYSPQSSYNASSVDYNPYATSTAPSALSSYDTYAAPSNGMSSNVSSHNAYAPAAPLSGYGASPASPYGASASGSLGVSNYGQPPPVSQSFAPPITDSAAPPPPPPKRDVSGWNDVPNLGISAPKRAPSAAGQATKAAITSPFPNSATPTFGSPVHNGQPLPPPPRGATPAGRPAIASPPPGTGYGPPRPGVGQVSGVSAQPGVAPGARPPPPRPGNAMQPGQPGPYGPPPGQASAPPRPPSGPTGARNGIPPGNNAYRPAPGVAGPPRPPGAAGMPAGMPAPPQQQVPQAAPPRVATPGAGAGPPPRNTAPAKPVSKYPPGDRSHIPDAQKPIFAVLSRELARIKTAAPPQQKRMVDDTERRLNILFDALNCGTVEDKTVQGLLQLIGAIESRNQQAALNIHLQIAATVSGEIGAALVGVKMIAQRM